MPEKTSKPKERSLTTNRIIQNNRKRTFLNSRAKGLKRGRGRK